MCTYPSDHKQRVFSSLNITHMVALYDPVATVTTSCHWRAPAEGTHLRCSGGRLDPMPSSEILGDFNLCPSTFFQGAALFCQLGYMLGQNLARC